MGPWLAGALGLALAACGGGAAPATRGTGVATRLPGCPTLSLQPFTSRHVSSRDAAAVAARTPGYAGLITVRQGHIADFYASDACGADDGHAVWAVVIYGSFSYGSCGAAPPPRESPHPCPSPASTAVVLLDYATGAFVSQEFPAPRQYTPPPGY